MRRTVILAMLLAAGCAAHGPSASSHAAAKAPSTRAPWTGARIVLSPDGGALRASYASLPAASSFSFTTRVPKLRSETWKALDPDVSVVDEGVFAPAPADHFAIAIAPDVRPRDRMYPALTRFGEGFVLFAPYLRIEGSENARVSAELPTGWTTVGRKAADGELAADGYLYIGPTAYVRHGVVDMVATPSTPGWLEHEIDASAKETTAYFERRLGLGLASRPTILMTHTPERKDFSFHGDTTSGAMISLRFYGPEWNEPQGSATETLALFVPHELFHLWNGEMVSSADGATKPWLHEGGAEYAALLASRARGAFGDEKVRATLDGYLDRCQAALPDRDLRTQGPKNGGGTYACGTLLEWAIDLGMRRTTKDNRDVLSWWRDVIAKARADGGTYTLESAYALVPPDAKRAADVLLDRADAGRWDAFAEAARSYGAVLEQRRSPPRDLAKALDHVLGLHCGRRHGFRTFPDRVDLDGGRQCGPLAAIREVDAIAGFHPVKESSAMYDELVRLCAAGKPIPFSYRGIPVAKPTCTSPLPSPPLIWSLGR